jgi:hypothetical protein
MARQFSLDEAAVTGRREWTRAAFRRSALGATAHPTLCGHARRSRSGSGPTAHAMVDSSFVCLA